MEKMKCIVSRINEYLEEDLNKLFPFVIFQMVLFVFVSFEAELVPVGHWMRGFACALLLWVSAMVEYEFSEQKLGNTIQQLISIGFTVWALVDSRLLSHVEVQHFLAMIIAMEITVTARMIEPSFDDVKSSHDSMRRHLFALSNCLSWILAPVLMFFGAAYYDTIYDNEGLSLYGATALGSMIFLPVYYKAIYRDWRRIVRRLNEQ